MRTVDPICRFCSDLERAVASEDPEARKEFYFTYKACLVQQTRNRDAPTGSQPLTQTAGKTRKLNFCPECGTHINWIRLTGGKRW